MSENDTPSDVLPVENAVEPTSDSTTAIVPDIALVDFLPKEELSDHYELLILMGGTMTDEEAALVSGNVKTLLTDAHATITHDEILGRRSLGYTVAKSRTGVYSVLEFNVLKNRLPDVQEKLRLRKDIVRFLIIKKRVKTAEEIAENERIQRKIAERRSAKKATQEADQAAAEAEAHAAKKKAVEEVQTPVPTPTETPASRPKKTLEDIDKEIDRILGGDIEL